MRASTRIVYVMSSLGRGGAERQLYLLLRHLDRREFAPTVVSLSEGGAWAGPIRDLGVEVVELPRRRHLEVRRLAALVRILRRTQPDVVQTSGLYDNLYGFVAARLARVPVVIASRRGEDYGRAAAVAERLNRLLWRRADAIICNAERSLRALPPRLAARHVVIPNGVELSSASARREEVRRALGVDDGMVLVGSAGRLVPSKNWALFLDVAATVRAGRGDVRFVVAGDGPLRESLAAHGAVRFLGERPDVPDLLAAMDVFLFTSDREGMSNAIIEAMAAGLPCVVTDAGAAAAVIEHGVSGYVYPRGDRAALASRVIALAGDAPTRAAVGARARRRIDVECSAETMAARTGALYRRLLARVRASRGTPAHVAAPVATEGR